jgi:predicted phosphodiesterase
MLSRAALPAALQAPALGRSLARGGPLAARLLFLAGVLAGIAVSLAAYGQTSGRAGPVEATVHVSPSARGIVDVYVPLVAWGLRARPYRSPVRLAATVDRVDRRATRRAVGGRTTPALELAAIRADAPDLVARAVRRAALVALTGGVLGGTCAGALLAAATRRRRLLLRTAGWSAVVTAVIVAAAVAGVRQADADAFREPEFYAHGGELPRLLRLSDQVLAGGDNYRSTYDEAVRSIGVLVGVAPAGPPAKTVLVASDLHSNTLTLPAFARYARGRPVFLVGDYAQQGTPLEAALIARAARLGTPTVAVSGNHDSPFLMRRLAAAGAIVLTEDGRLHPDGAVSGAAVVTVDGLRVAGFGDPLGGHAGSFGHRVELTEAELTVEAARLIAWYGGLEAPDIVLVHDVRLGEQLLRYAGERGDEVVILSGHDHEQRVEQLGAAVLVDDGTLGGGGLIALGEAPAGFAALHLSAANLPEAVDLFSADPATGEATAERIAVTRDEE